MSKIVNEKIATIPSCVVHVPGTFSMRGSNDYIQI